MASKFCSFVLEKITHFRSSAPSVTAITPLEIFQDRRQIAPPTARYNVFIN